MEKDKMAGGQHPMERASIFSKLVYFWLLPLLRKGHKENLTSEDIYVCPGRNKVTALKEKINKYWRRELENKKKGKKPSLLRAVLKTFGFTWILSIGIIVIKECIVQPGLAFCLGLLVKEESIYSLTVMPALLCLLLLVYQACHHLYILRMQRLGMDLRVACSALVYDKSLRLSQASLRRTTAGQIVNLLSNDVTRFDMGLGMISYILVAPLQVILIAVLIYVRYSPFLLIGFAVVPLYLVLQSVMAKLFARFRLKTAELTDERIRLMNEVVSGMRVIKMYAWETFFASHVDTARKKELKEIKKTSFLKGLNSSMFFVASKIMLFVSLVAAALLTTGAITPESVFVLMTLTNAVRLTTTLFFPMGISFGAESLTALRRLQNFLEMEEQEENKLISASSIRPKPDQCGIKFSEVTCQWNKDSPTPTLQNISLTVEPGELVMVVGAVGAGKSSLLLSLLGELPVTKGRVEIKGKVAYSSQEPWLFAGTLRENILFGRPFDAARYHSVIQVSSLERDLEILPYGDRTMVGERGVSLSGGQKARVNLARALYQDADIYLLDDPLSAVDANVSKHIFEKCIKGFLKNKCRILCTHQIQFLSQADKIVIINKEGQIQNSGTYKQLIDAGEDFGTPADVKTSTTSLTESEASEHETKETTADTRGGGEAPMPVKTEEMATGSINPQVYYGYLRAGSNVFWQVLLLLTYLGSQFLFNGSDYYLMIWSNYEAKPHAENSNTHTKFINVYMALVVGLFISSLLRNLGFFTLCLRASRRLHADLAYRLFRAPMAFFDTNPVGNILNRCSRDMGVIDDLLPQTASECIEILFAIAGILVVISVIRWFLLLPALVVVGIFVFMRQFFLGAARDIKRLEGRARAPVLSHLATSLDGLASLRAYGAQKDFLQTYADLQDSHTAAWFLYVTASEWFGVAVDLMCLTYIALVTVAMVTTASGPGGDIGLAVASALGLSGEFMWGARQSAEVESHMTSVERVLQYSKLDEEASPDSKNPPSPGWPLEGAISFRNISLRYSPEAPLVLDGINWEVKPGEKVGIVGRTGAGKSSILAALLRLAEPSSGEVIIDGVRTSDLGLRDLRRAVAIIPQDPVLFTGTVRQNLDPLGEHNDSELWSSLEEVHLKASLEGPGLDSPLSSGSLSLGQRQLLCLARAVLRGSRILVLDEATANVDPDTDALIQETIRERFTKQTVLAIAHRLHTVMGYDRVLVMEAGTVKEYGSPAELIDKPDGLLNSMVRATGAGTAQQLREMAYNNNRDEITRL